MVPLSSTLAWKIPWAEEPGRLQSMGQLSRTQLTDFTSLFTFMPWIRKWQPTSVFFPGESQGRGNLVSCHLWGCIESDMTEATQQQQQQQLYSWTSKLLGFRSFHKLRMAKQMIYRIFHLKTILFCSFKKPLVLHSWYFLVQRNVYLFPKQMTSEKHILVRRGGFC